MATSETVVSQTGVVTQSQSQSIKVGGGGGGYLDVEHLLVDLLHGHAAAEDGGHGEVAAVARVAGGHHVLGVEHLLRQFGHRQRAVVLRAARRQRREARHEEVQPRERHLPQHPRNQSILPPKNQPNLSQTSQTLSNLK